jgi:membrane protease YdiL (CAAX protease family)
MQVWRVLATYVAAVAGILAASVVAVVVLRGMFPDDNEQALLQSLSALVVGSLASSTALLFTIVFVVRPSSPASLRLLPGWETGRALAVAILGMLALGQFLDSLAWLVGLGQHGSMVIVRRLIESASGPELFGAVVVFGAIAGTAEEIFFRGYMQTRLREAWGPARAIVATSVAFGILHVDMSGIHMVMAFAMGLYLGTLVEATGSVLPAIVCHVVNNAVYTMQTALGGTLHDRRVHGVIAAGCLLLFALCLSWLRRAAPPPAPAA